MSEHRRWRHHYLNASDGQTLYLRKNFSGDPTATPLVFLYGLVCSHHHWSRQIDYFDQKNIPVILPDYRGHYNSAPLIELESLTFERICDDLISIFDHEKTEKVLLVGHSMGVNLAMEVARRFPKRVQALALVCGPTRPVHQIMLGSDITATLYPALKSFFLRSPQTLEKIWKSSEWNPLATLFLTYSGFNPKLIPKQFVELYLKRLSTLAPAVFFQLFEEMMAHDCMEFAHSIEHPTLVVSGLKDKVILPEVQEELCHALPQGNAYLMFEGSHVPQADSPEQFNDRLSLFYDKYRQAQ